MSGQFKFMDKVMQRTGSVVFVGFYLGTVQTRAYGTVYIGETLHGSIFMGGKFEPFDPEMDRPSDVVVIGVQDKSRPEKRLPPLITSKY